MPETCPGGGQGKDHGGGVQSPKHQGLLPPNSDKDGSITGTLVSRQPGPCRLREGMWPSVIDQPILLSLATPELGRVYASEDISRSEGWGRRNRCRRLEELEHRGKRVWVDSRDGVGLN